MNRLLNDDFQYNVHNRSRLVPRFQRSSVITDLHQKTLSIQLVSIQSHLDLSRLQIG